MKTIDKAFNWLLLSSKDPKQASLTFKGILIGIIPLIMILLQLSNVQVSNAEVNIVINQATTIVKDFLFIVAAVVTTYGAVRKVYLTIK